MTIEKTTGTKNYYVYRLSGRTIYRKRNTRYARWQKMPEGTYATEAAALEAWKLLGKEEQRK